MLNEFAQFDRLLRNCRHILIAINPSDQGDGIGAALALKRAAENLHKHADIASTGFVLPKNLKFVSGAETVKPALDRLQKFVIKVDVREAPVDSLSYDIKDGWLSIYLTPNKGVIGKNQLRTGQSAYKYDLIIALNVPELSALGDIYQNNTDLFYRTPVVNIDRNPGNEFFGQVNLVDMTAIGTTEIVYRFLKEHLPDALDTETATALLTGLIATTHSFKSPNVNPGTLSLAGELISLGADREKIIRNLYRTRSLAALKLWGQALSRINYYHDLKLASVALTRQDFTLSGATEEDAADIVSELISTSPEAESILLIYETAEEKMVKAIYTAEKNPEMIKRLASFRPEGSNNKITMLLPETTLAEAETKIVEKIRTEKK